jgi:hypothetical protein
LVEVSKEQKLPTGGTLIFGRQYYRKNHGRGFQLQKHEFDTYGQEVLKQAVRDLYPDHHKGINRILDVSDIEHSNYLCEPDFEVGFQCYYRFKVKAIVMKNSDKVADDVKADLPDEFQLSVEASDSYSQTGRVFSGLKTKFYRFNFSQIYKELEQTEGEGRDMQFDFINEDIIFANEEKRDFKSLEVFASDFAFVIDRFEYRSDDYAAELRGELAKRIKEGNVIKSFNSSVREDYTNSNVKCSKGKLKGYAFSCVEKDTMTLSLNVEPKPVVQKVVEPPKAESSEASNEKIKPDLEDEPLVKEQKPKVDSENLEKDQKPTVTEKVQVEVVPL